MIPKNPTIGEGVLDPNEPAPPVFVIDGFFWVVMPTHIEFSDPLSTMDWSVDSFAVDDECPF